MHVLTHILVGLGGCAVGIIVWEIWLERRGETIYDRLIRRLREEIAEDLDELVRLLRGDSNRSW